MTTLRTVLRSVLKLVLGGLEAKAAGLRHGESRKPETRAG